MEFKMENVKFAVYDPISGTNSNPDAPIGLPVYEDEENRITLIINNTEGDNQAYLVNDFHEEDWDILGPVKGNLLDMVKEYLQTR